MQVHLGARGEKPAACALTIGNFDGVHLGHQSMLAQLRQYAQLRQLPTALLTFEPHPREVFARQSPPARLATLRDKLGFLAETGLVDHVFVYRRMAAVKNCMAPSATTPAPTTQTAAL